MYAITVNKKNRILTCMVSHQCECDDDSIVWHGVRILCHTLRKHMAFLRCVYVRDSSSVAIEKIAYRKFDICNGAKKKTTIDQFNEGTNEISF